MLAAHFTIFYCCKVTVKDPAKAKFVEAAIPFRDMTSFVCQNTEDLHLFVQEVITHVNWSFSTSVLPHVHVKTW